MLAATPCLSDDLGAEWLLESVYDTLPDGKKRNRLISPWMLLCGAVGLCFFLIALALVYFVSGEHPTTPRIFFLGDVTEKGRLLELALSLGGLFAILGFGGPFVANLFHALAGALRPGQAVVLKEAVRRRVWVFLSILVLYLFPARWFFQEKPEDELKSIVGVTTRGMNVLLVSVGLCSLLSASPRTLRI